jgi:exopolysaccharide biosynthesis polyprenyl glycosylphosphotransferase
MKARTSKLLIILLYESLFFIGACLLVTKINNLFMHTEIVISLRLILILVLFFALYFFLMWQSLYSRNYHYYLKKTYRIVIKNTTISVFMVFIITALLTGIDRSTFVPFLLVYLPMGTISFFIMHGTQYMWIRYLSHIGYFRKDCLVIGMPDERFPLNTYFQDIGNTKNYIGMVSCSNGRWEGRIKSNRGAQSIESVDEIKRIILKENIGEVIFFLGNGLQRELLLDMVKFCQRLTIGYYLVPDISQLPKKQLWDKIFPYIPVLERFPGQRDSLTDMSLKRLLDICISVVSLVLFIPLGIFISLAIKLEDGGPVFYTATRVGKNGKPIRFYKFRTMTVDADEKKQMLLEFNERSDGPLFKMKNDPRVTNVGQFLRRYSLDEFPQLFNVILGNMSLIGPRPHLPQEVAEYEGSDYLRLECIPGIVGLPQIAGRNTMGFKEWVNLDLKYRKNWSLALDLKIMVKTVKIILSSVMRHESSGY